MNRTLERILPKVQKPARYTGGEYNAVVKDRAQVDTRYALCFPDTYEIGMSNLGMRILYGAMNQVEGLWCERAFAPWGDMEEEMRREGIQLYGLESGDPLCDFDIIGFSLGYEMAYTNVLNMLDLAGLPLRSEERRDLAPLVVAGGTCAYNPEPLAPFVDFFVLGEGEEVTLEYIALYRRARDEDWTKEELLREAARIPGIYVPSFYEPVYRPDGTLEEMRIREGSGAPELVRKRVVEDMNKSYFPVKTIIPSTEIVHDRVMLELFRGCIRGCRFCQAGYVYRPVRSRDPKQLAEYGKAACEDSGYQEMTLSSLSSTDYPCLLELCDDLLDYCAPRDIGLSLPSLRADTFSMNLMERLQRVRKGGLTFAPEAGTQRLRDAINKNLREEDLLQSCRTAFAGPQGLFRLEGVHSQPQAGGADYGVHLLVRAQAPHGLPVGGPDPRGGVPAACGPAAGRPEAGQVHHLQLARPPDQLSGGYLLPGGPPPGRRVGVGLAAWGQVRLLERVFRLPAVDGCPGGLRAGWGLLRPPGAAAQRGVSLVPHRPHGDPRFPVA